MAPTQLIKKTEEIYDSSEIINEPNYSIEIKVYAYRELTCTAEALHALHQLAWV